MYPKQSVLTPGQLSCVSCMSSSRLGKPRVLCRMLTRGDNFQFDTMNVSVVRKPNPMTPCYLGLMMPVIRGFLTGFTAWFRINNDIIWSNRASSHRPLWTRPATGQGQEPRQVLQGYFLDMTPAITYAVAQNILEVPKSCFPRNASIKP